MAYARTLSSRATIIARRCNPSFAYILHNDDRKHQSPERPQSEPRNESFVLSRSFGTGFYNSTRIGSFFQEPRCSNLVLLPSNSFLSCHYMSTTSGNGLDEAELMTDVAAVLKDTTIDVVASTAPAVNEVAIAVADSAYPVAALQYFIDAVHSFTGYNWWASIIITTLLIRGATIPLLINQLKSTAKLTLMRPRLEALKQELEEKGRTPTAMVEFQVKMKDLFNEFGVNPFSPLKGLFIQGPIFISFFYAITNMAEKVPSFKSGGAFWFTDLTTPDNLYILPVLTGLTFLITVECNMQDGMEGNPLADTMKKFSRILAVLSVPVTCTFPKAIFCYWVTSNLFSLGYGLALKAPGVRKALGVSDIPMPPPTAQPTPSSADLFSAIRKSNPTSEPVEPPTAQPTPSSADPFSAIKKSELTSETTSEPISEPVEPPKVSKRTISSSSVVSQRLRSLEKQVKGRKKKDKM